MKPMTILYTIQKPGHDLTKRCKPLADYLDATSPYYPLAHHLGWKQWAWCLESLDDFIWNNDWLDFEPLLHHTLWRLIVPLKNIVWCSLDRQCENSWNVEAQIQPDPFTIRLKDEIPMGLVKNPIKREWVLSKETASDVFQRANLLDEFYEDSLKAQEDMV